MGAYLSCTVLYQNHDGEYEVEDDYGFTRGPLTGDKSSARAALLCNNGDGLNFKERTGPHPVTAYKPAVEAMMFSEPEQSTATTRPGCCSITWYHVTELHELMNSVPGALEILGKPFVDEVYRILQDHPKAIIQFACDQ